MKPEQQRAWFALGLGPRWVARGTTASVATVTEERAPESVQAVPMPALPAIAGSEAVPPSVASMDWSLLREAVSQCTACALSRSRRNTVFGVGPTSARWVIIGEAPGAEEDARGEPFVGQAGKLLDAMLGAIGLNRERDVFITNVLKCRPPGNRNPEPDEVRCCSPYLHRQLALLQPEGILLMGRFAAQAVLDTEASIASLRGRVHRLKGGGSDRPVVVTYHPAYLLRNLPDKAKAWADLCLARSVFGQDRDAVQPADQ